MREMSFSSHTCKLLLRRSRVNQLVCFFLLLRIFSVAISVSPHDCLFYLRNNFDFYVSKIMHL